MHSSTSLTTATILILTSLLSATTASPTPKPQPQPPAAAAAPGFCTERAAGSFEFFTVDIPAGDDQNCGATFEAALMASCAFFDFSCTANANPGLDQFNFFSSTCTATQVQTAIAASTGGNVQLTCNRIQSF